MQLSQILLTFAILLPTTAFARWDRTWWLPASGTAIEASDVAEQLAASPLIVIGEEHYNPAVQAAEADIIRQLKEPTLGWEFLDRSDASKIEQAFASFMQSDLSGGELVAQLLPNSPQAATYAPVFEALRATLGTLIPTNLSHAQKRPVTRGGLAAIDPTLIPEGFALGEEDYFRRFVAAMGAHPLPFPIENYFAAQCLTDDVMAVSLLEGFQAGPSVLITGSFHGDFKHGVVHRLAQRSSEVSPLYIKIVDASEVSEAELRALFRDEHFGPVADLVLVVGEPLP